VKFKSLVVELVCCKSYELYDFRGFTPEYKFLPKSLLLKGFIINSHHHVTSSPVIRLHFRSKQRDASKQASSSNTSQSEWQCCLGVIVSHKSKKDKDSAGPMSALIHQKSISSYSDRARMELDRALTNQLLN